MTTSTPDNVPPDLVAAILGGRCVAFVGAGFSQPAVLGWGDLLAKLAGRLELQLSVPATATALELELIGQALRDKAGDSLTFEKHVQEVIDESLLNKPDGHHLVKERARLLQSIPFKAIFTTNFDPILVGGDTGSQTYWNVLRKRDGRWWEFPVGVGDSNVRPSIPVIKLHGDANGDPNKAAVVLGRTDYRSRVYGENGYTGFIRAAFANYTPLFLGVSFTDAYLNELRSETLSFLHDAPGGQPWGYAVMNITEDNMHLPELYREHEHIEILPTTEHSQFDEWLRAIEARTSARGRLQSLLRGKRIVWIDARPANNKVGRELFEGCDAKVTTLLSEDELSADEHASADLLITHFGYNNPGSARAYRVLDALRRWSSGPPVLVFTAPGTPTQLESRRRECIRRGAWEYATKWGELYRLIETLLARQVGDPVVYRTRDA